MNKSHFLFIPFIVIMFLLLQNQANAQFEVQKNYLGPSIGFSFLGSTPDFGANYEYGMEFQNFGKVGIGGLFRYWSYTDGYFSYTDILIGAQGNYHFVLDNSKIDPFVGLILAYDAGTAKWSGPYAYSVPTYGGLWLAAQGGVRYWISPNIAISGRIGLGTLSYSGLDFGVDFKF